LKKRTKKLFPLGSAAGTAHADALATPRNREKSLFASFSSEKEGFTFAFRRPHGRFNAGNGASR
jgi:hypothetical protein